MKIAFKKWILFVSFGALLLLLGAYLFRNPLFGSLIRSFLENALEENLRVKARVDRVAGTFLTSLSLEGIHCTGKDESPLRSLSIHQLEVSYDLLSLLLGSPPLRSLQASKVHLEVDLQAKGKEGSGKGAKPRFEEIFPEPESLPQVLLEGVSLRLSRGEEKLFLPGLTLSLSKEGEGLCRGALHGKGVQYCLNGREGRQEVLHMSFAYTGTDLSIEELRIGTDRIQAYMHLDLSRVSEESLSFHVHLQLPKGEADLMGDLGSLESDPRGEFSGMAEGVPLSAARAILGEGFPSAEGILRVSLHAGGRLSHPRSWAGEARMRVEELSYQDQSLDALEILARLQGEVLKVDKASLRGQGIEAFIAGVQGKFPRFKDMDLDSLEGAFSVQIREPCPLLSLLPLSSPLKEELSQCKASLRGAIRGSRIIIQEGAFCAPGNMVRIDRASVILSRSEPPSEWFWEGACTADLQRLTPFLDRTVEDLRAERLSLNAIFQGSLSHPQGEGEIHLSRAQYKSLAVDRGAIKAKGARSGIAFEGEFERRADPALPGDKVSFSGLLVPEKRLLEEWVLEGSLDTLNLSAAGALEWAEREAASIRLHRGTVLLEKGAWELEKETEIVIRSEGIHVGATTIRSPGGFFSLEGDLRREGFSTLSVQARDFSLDPFFRMAGMEEASATLQSADLAYTGTLERPALSLAAVLREAHFPVLGDTHRGNAGTLSGELKAFLEEGTLKIERFLLSEERGGLLEMAGFLPFPLGEESLENPISLSAKIDHNSFGLLLAHLLPARALKAGPLAGTIAIRGTPQSPVAEGEFTVKSLSLPPSPGDGLGPPLSGDLSLRFSYEDEVLALHQALLRMNGGEYLAQGIVPVDLSLPALLQGSPLFEKGGLDLSFSGEKLDLAPLPLLVEEVRQAEGAATLRCRATGSIKNPSIKGEIQVEKGKIKFASQVPSIEELAASILFDERGATIRKMKAELGAGPISLDGGIKRNGESLWEADLRITGERVLLLRNEGIKVRSNLDLALKGPFNRLLLQGSCRVADSRLIRNIMIALREESKPEAFSGIRLFSFRHPPLSTLQFQVQFSSDGGFLVKNNLYRGSLYPDLRLLGTGENPFLEGNIRAFEGTILLPWSKLNVDSGIITFTKSRPSDPSINLSASAKLKGYQIQAVVEGFLSDPQVHISSSPFLSNEDLLVLLATGNTPEDMRETGIKKAALSKVGSYVGEKILETLLSSPAVEGGRSFADRFTLAVGEERTRKGGDTIRADFQVKEPFYIQAEKDCYDDFNFNFFIKWKFK